MKTFLSIGSGPGIGLATAERFAREGFRVVLSSRSLTRIQGLAERLQAKGYEVEAHAVDAGNAGELAALVADVERRHGAIDVLHYNAANIRQASISTQPLETFNTDLAVNIGGALVAIQAAIGTMASRRSGSILLTGGFFGIDPNPDYLSLSLGKAGIRALALGLFKPYREQGVHVATVTVAAYIKPDSAEARAVADEFWALHNQPLESWTSEATFSV